MAAVGLGLGLGLANGLASRAALKWAIGRSDKVFYGVWGVGFLYRLLFAAGFIWFLIKHPVVPLVPAVLALIVAEIVPQVFPIKGADGKKRA